MRKRKTWCWGCNREAEHVGPISLAGLCRGCGKQRQIDNAEQIIDREGPYYERWLTGIKAAAAKAEYGLTHRRNVDATR